MALVYRETCFCAIREAMPGACSQEGCLARRPLLKVALRCLRLHQLPNLQYLQSNSSTLKTMCRVNARWHKRLRLLRHNQSQTMMPRGRRSLLMVVCLRASNWQDVLLQK